MLRSPGRNQREHERILRQEQDRDDDIGNVRKVIAGRSEFRLSNSVPTIQRVDLSASRAAAALVYEPALAAHPRPCRLTPQNELLRAADGWRIRDRGARARFVGARATVRCRTRD